MKRKLTLNALIDEARTFASSESKHPEPSIFGVTDGKAVGTYFEHKFRRHLEKRYAFQPGSSARGIDYPNLNVDVKVTSVRQPQSSCPYKAARQKIYGLGYSLLVFVYDKSDNSKTKTGTLNVLHTILVKKNLTGDYQTTTGIRQIIDRNGNVDDIVAFMQERFLPVDEIQAQPLAEEILRNPPKLGYLTISNALQWRLQYQRVIETAGQIEGILRIR